MLEIKDVDVSYDNITDVLKNINLTIGEHEWVGIIGKSGSGKSTLLRTINGLVMPKNGNVLFQNQEVTKLSKKQLRNLRRHIAFIFQNYNLIDSLSVVENVLTARLGYQNTLQSIFSIFTDEDYKRAEKAITRVGLQEKMFELAKNLSGGQKQRVAIAKALCQDAELILADEPVSSLDPKTTITIMEYFKRIFELKKKTIIINLHNVELAKTYCTRIIGIYEGQIIFDGTAGELTDDIIKKLYN